MSYCKNCGAYIPDWAEECPACGRAKAEPKKRVQKRAGTDKTGAASVGRGAPEGGAAAQSGEYHYSYKKPAGDSRRSAGERWGSAARGATDAGGAYTYGGDGAYAYDEGGGRGRGRSRRDSRSYEDEYRSDAKSNRGFGALCYFGPFFIISWLARPKSAFVRYHVNQGLVLFLCSVIFNLFDFIPFMWLLNLLIVVDFFCGIANALGGRRKPIPLIGEITLIK